MRTIIQEAEIHTEKELNLDGDESGAVNMVVGACESLGERQYWGCAPYWLGLEDCFQGSTCCALPIGEV